MKIRNKAGAIARSRFAGRHTRKSLIVGSVEQYATESQARRAAQALLLGVNADSTNAGLRGHQHLEAGSFRLYEQISVGQPVPSSGSCLDDNMAYEKG